MSTNEKQSKPNVEIINGYQVPKWAGKPPSGLHLDVMKEGKMIQKLMIDEKKCYFFGRNKDVCDFVIDHASCSRVHAVLMWHKDLNRSFIVDLDSTHGTFIGSIRLEPNKPQQVFLDSELKFGASTRTYIVREKPQVNKHAINPSSIMLADTDNSAGVGSNDKEDSFPLLTSLPESETELDNLTEFNTAHNKRIAQLVDINTSSTSSSIPNTVPSLVKQKRKSVTFNEEEEIINPEDIDPTIGRFRNLVQTTIVIPNKKRKIEGGPGGQGAQPLLTESKKSSISSSRLSLYEDEENEDEDRGGDIESRFSLLSDSIMSNLGMRALDIAPDVDEVYHDEHYNRQHKPPVAVAAAQHHAFQIHEYDQTTGKKKYAKEAWPGRHPGTGAVSTTATAPISTTTSSMMATSVAPLIAPTTAPNLPPSTSKRLAI